MQSVDSDIERLLQDAAGFTHDPLGFVLYAFDWGKGDLAKFAGPYDWQKDFLNSIGDRLKAGEIGVQEAIQEAVASGHGVGKSALVAWLIIWAISTCEDTRGIVTANTENQLKTKTWAELSKWHRLSICKDWFTCTATAIYSADPAHEKTWRVDMVAWTINNTESFAGLHNQGKRILVIFDEGSAIADQIYEVTEGALTDADTEIIWCIFGNPTRNTGRFRECFGKLKHRWKTYCVDSREVPNTNKGQIQQWIEDYGEDSDFVRVRVRGLFPRAGSNQFIGSDVVDACKKYKAEGYDGLAKVFGVDVARFGDDQNVVCIRQGRRVLDLIKWRGIDTMQTASKVMELIGEHEPDLVFVDGVGVGGGVVDRLVQLAGQSKICEVNAGSTADDTQTYFNKRAEMWGRMRDALKAGVELPDDNELSDELSAPEYGFDPKNRIQLEKKEDMKKRGLSSPDCADALALTYAQNVIKKRPTPIRLPDFALSQSEAGWMGA